MSSFFLKIVNMSIAASWLILAVVLLRVVLKKAPKWINVLLWGIVAFRLICPFSFESALSLIPSAETISPEIMMDWTPEISTGVSSIDKVVNPIITDTFAPEPIASANPLQLLIPVLAIVWAIGIIAMLVYAAVSYFYEEYNLSEEGIESVGGGCGPVALTFNVTENGYELSEYWEPGDGSQYSDDIRKKFPEDILDEVWNPQDYVDAMTAENEQKALEFSAQK